LSYVLSLRDLEEMIAERGIGVDRSTIHRWVIRYAPQMLEAFRGLKRTVMPKWHVDETYIKVKGEWTYLYRAIDNGGTTVDFIFSATRNQNVLGELPGRPTPPGKSGHSAATANGSASSHPPRCHGR
jgi:transposase-like protein